MAEKGETKILAIITICIIFIIIVISGCISPSEFEIPPEGSSKHPDDPSISIDSKGNAHIVWENGTGSKKYPKHLSYLTIDQKGNKITSIKKLNGYDPRILIDSNDEIHLIDGSTYYTKFNNNGTVKIDRKIILINNSGIISEDKIALIDKSDIIHIFTRGKGIWHTFLDNEGNRFKEFNLVPNNNISYCMRADIDSNNDAHISYQSLDNNTFNIHYIKQNNDGIIKNQCIVSTKKQKSPQSISSPLRNSFLIVDQKSNVFIFWEEYEKSSLHNPSYTFLNKYNTTGKLIFTKEIPSQQISNIIIDLHDNLHIIGSTGYDGGLDNVQGTYMKVDNNGSILIKSRIFSNKIGVNVPISAKMDYRQNIHLSWYGIETKLWERGRYLKEYSLYTIYYSKISNNGIVLIDNMIIDADEEPSWENGENNIQFSICLILIAIPIAIVILIIVLKLLKKQNKKDHSK